MFGQVLLAFWSTDVSREGGRLAAWCSSVPEQRRTPALTECLREPLVSALRTSCSCHRTLQAPAAFGALTLGVQKGWRSEAEPVDLRWLLACCGSQTHEKQGLCGTWRAWHVSARRSLRARETGPRKGRWAGVLVKATCIPKGPLPGALLSHCSREDAAPGECCSGWYRVPKTNPGACGAPGCHWGGGTGGSTQRCPGLCCTNRQW